MSIYDGKKFTNYSEENGLKDNRIWDLDIDSKNNYWLALFRNLMGKNLFTMI